MPYCENCGSQVNSNAKFCGNCGAARTIETPTTKTPVNAQPAQPKRERLSYYSPPSPNSMPLQSSAPPIMQPSTFQAPPQMQQAQPIPQAQVGSEPTYGVIVFRRMKSLGRWDTYTGVLTSQRLLFAQMTNEMIKSAAQQ